MRPITCNAGVRESVAVNVVLVKSPSPPIRPEHFRGRGGQATQLAACRAPGFASPWRGDRASRETSTRCPRSTAEPPKPAVKTVSPHAPPRRATRAAHGRFQKPDNLCSSSVHARLRRPARRASSHAAIGQRQRDTYRSRGGAPASQCLVSWEHKLRLHNTVWLVQPRRRCQPKWHAAPPSILALCHRHHARM